ncbi:CD109 antigen [Pelobates cultripes]|uniref:CD109 antigen n=1 Tax=Pelobates cultripes TaxID=61616 RepID=A0AAD1VT68_PELCU|nr:CD109 antigen [Pelobates cultripes]
METTGFFTVSDYVFQRFEVKINTPAFYVEPKKLNLEGTVTAKNVFGKSINGNVTVSLNSLYYNYMSTNSINKTYTISGSANFSFTYEEISYLLNWGGINITASVTEDFTGIVTHGLSQVEKTDSDYTLFIVTEPRETTPGLNFTAQLQVLRFDNASLTEEERNKIVTVKIIQSTTEYWFSELFSNASLDNVSLTTPSSNPGSVIVREYTTPESGIINISFPIIQSVQVIKIEAQYQNTTQNWILEKYGRLNGYAQIRISSSVKKVGETFQVEVNTLPKSQKLYYTVMARGVIVFVGQTTNSSFTLTPEHSWAPQATIIIYFMINNGEGGDIMQTSETIHIQGLFQNKVSLSWSTNLTQPSENVSLAVNVSKPRSLVGVWVTERISDLEEYRNYFTASRVEGEIIANTEGLGNTLSDLMINYANFPSDELIPISRIFERVSYTPIRNNAFNPETWLWLETNISSGATTNLQVTTPQTNSTWMASAFVISEEHGLGFTEESVEMEVFQPLSMTMNLPYSVVRNEQFILEAGLFNNLPENREVTVTLKNSDSFEVILPRSDPSTIAGLINVIVPSHDTKIVQFPINPKKLGEISMTVTAISSEESYTVTQNIFVKAEGVKRFYTEAAIFDLAGAITQTDLKSFLFTFPNEMVKDSEEAFITVHGDLLAPSIDGLESLIQMPYGCGEQNMINFAPNIYVLHYLIAAQKLKEDIRTQAINFMILGYQRELSYKRSDDSFSAFGNIDDSGSTWLTSFVLRCFLQARPFIFISQDVLDQMVQWLVQYQDISTGIFSEPGRVIHTELQGGLNGPITLTAYILTSLLEDEDYRIQYEFHINKALQYLESKFDQGISSNYVLSVVAYALTLANSTRANKALTQLNSRASNTEGLQYWPSPSGTTNHWQPQSSEIETAAYALLSHYKQNRVSEGIPIMKWLSQQRSHLGGYSSTQDTIMALQALAQFLSVLPTGETSLNITVTGYRSFVPITFQINNDNLLALQSQQITVSQPLSINVSAVGRGRAIFQLNIYYNQRESLRRRRNVPESEEFTLDITVNDDQNNIQWISVDVCASYQGTKDESGMILLDVGYLSGFTLGPEGIPLSGSLKLVETKEDRVYIYFDMISKTPVCVSVPLVRVATVANSQDAVVTIMDYYNPTNKVTKMYNSETMKNVSLFDFCGFNFTLCASNVLVNAQPTPQSTVYGNSQTTIQGNPNTTTQGNLKTTIQGNAQTIVHGIPQTTSSATVSNVRVYGFLILCIYYILFC